MLVSSSHNTESGVQVCLCVEIPTQSLVTPENWRTMCASTRVCPHVRTLVDNSPHPDEQVRFARGPPRQIDRRRRLAAVCM